jgi:hypothetical protein
VPAGKALDDKMHGTGGTIVAAYMIAGMDRADAGRDIVKEAAIRVL